MLKLVINLSLGHCSNSTSFYIQSPYGILASNQAFILGGVMIVIYIIHNLVLLYYILFSELVFRCHQYISVLLTRCSFLCHQYPLYDPGAMVVIYMQDYSKFNDSGILIPVWPPPYKSRHSLFVYLEFRTYKLTLISS